mmetsp:Transcript_21674/g.34710  ORF Transcript_21674/g.34710 Transcript_21674/m.34710 type:complete len:88 (-) Transcript_21674:217-480(-)
MRKKNGLISLGLQQLVVSARVPLSSDIQSGREVGRNKINIRRRGRAQDGFNRCSKSGVVQRHFLLLSSSEEVLGPLPLQTPVTNTHG